MSQLIEDAAEAKKLLRGFKGLDNVIEAMERVGRLEDREAGYKSGIETLQAKYADLEKINTELQAQITERATAAEAEARGKLAEAEARAAKTIADAENDIAQKRSDAEFILAGLKQETLVLQREADNLDTAIAAKRKELEDWETKVANSKEEARKSLGF